jgi:hypothetical protein
MAIATVCAVLAGMLVTSGPANAETYLEISNNSTPVGNIKYLDYISPANAAGTNGATVYLWSYNGQIQQKWVTSSGDGTLKTASNPNMCLDADVNSAGRNPQRVQLWTCNGSPQQKWLADSPTTNNYLVNQYSKKCLDADTNTANSNPRTLQAWTCNHTEQQSFRIFQS